MTAGSAYPIPVGRARVAFVDAQDVELVSAYSWHAHVRRNGKTYARTGRSGGVRIYMHRPILATADGMETDHRDGDGLNNRRANLRVATPSQNRANGPAYRKRATTASRYRGVHWSRGAWHASIRIAQELRHLGSFSDEDNAARAYDAAALEAWGEFAHLNLPEGT